MKLRIYLACYLSFACSIPDGSLAIQKEMQNFRVLGYLYVDENIKEEVDKVLWDSYTDINLAFVQPDSNGNFLNKSGYEYLVEKAHLNGVRAFISIGGGEPPEYLAKLMKVEYRSQWVRGIVDLVDSFEFDGVDVDLENALINNDYAPFVEELHQALKASGKLMTAALASWNGNKISKETMELYDFINIMSYDETGPWDLDYIGQHAPYGMGQNDIQYFHEVRGIPTSKLLLGLPLYGYGFGPGVPTSLKYKHIIEAYPNAYKQDSIVSSEGGIFYYNSPDLIRRKTKLALDSKLAGVMVWHISADSEGPNSLLKVINDTL